MMHLPIDTSLPQLHKDLQKNNAVVLQAPPGAGKTTRVPLSLLNAPWLTGQSIVMLQPRRIAARHAAEFMARELGETVGQTVGYSVRYDHKRSRTTRIEVVTEGILTRRLQNDPELTGVGLVIFDEFHERSIHSDLALALCRDMQLALREDLKILVMSATLDAEPVATLLDECPILTSKGKSFPVDIHYFPQPETAKIAEITANGIKTALCQTTGDILVFLPGVGEIKRCQQLLAETPDINILPLYGALPFREQQLALVPGQRRRVVLATNIAETSLTIEGIDTVVDSGWERRPRYDVGSGLTKLELKRVSEASATQRCGRAGRLGPGTCYRLWSKGKQAELLPQTPPEIRTADLAPLLLELACWGETDIKKLCWLDHPPESQVQRATDLLTKLDAIDNQGRITSLGKQMIRLPLPPRLARLVVAAQEEKLGALGCELAALLSERDLFARQPSKSTSICDLELRWRFLQNRTGTPELRPVILMANDLKRIIKATEPAKWPQENLSVQKILAQAWPDSIGAQREAGSGRYLLSDGGGAKLSDFSSLHNPPFLVALNMQQHKAEKEITLATSIDIEVLNQVFKNRLTTVRQIKWDDASERLTATEELKLYALTLAMRQIRATPEEQTAALLDVIRHIGIANLNWSSEAHQLRSRICLCRKLSPGHDWPDFSFGGLTTTLDAWLAPFISGISSKAALMQIDLLAPLVAALSWEQQKMLDQLAPQRISVPSGSQIKIDYSDETQPVLAVKLQELFGLQQTPTVVSGQMPLLIHMLSPAGRPLAVTQDLEFFWNNVYPEIRREMRGRYPKHPWPENPWDAQATAKTKKQSART